MDEFGNYDPDREVGPPSTEWNSQDDSDWYGEVSGCETGLQLPHSVLAPSLAGPLLLQVYDDDDPKRASPSRRLLRTWLHCRPLRVRGLDNAWAALVPAAEQHRAQTNSRRPKRVAAP